MRKPIALLALGLVAACGPAPTPSDLDVNGDWSEDWSCEETCSGSTETVTGNTDMTLTQSGSDVTREDTDGTTWTGTLSGNVLELSTSDATYSEDSTFTFNDDATSFTVESSYTSGDCTGTCTGTGARR